MKVPGLEHRDDVAAHVLMLQLPLEGSAAKGGIKMVLRTADEQWLGCSFQGSRHDFFISLGKVRCCCRACKVWNRVMLEIWPGNGKEDGKPRLGRLQPAGLPRSQTMNLHKLLLQFGADQEEEGEAVDSSDADGKPTQERLAQAIRYNCLSPQ